MSRPWIRSALGVLVIGVALVATIGEGSSGKSSNGVNSSNGATSSGTVAAASTQTAPIPVGTSAEVAKHWTVKVNSANVNANADLAAANPFNTPAAGTQYVTVNVSVSNGSNTPAASEMNVKFSLLPTTGVAITSTFAAGVVQEFDGMAQLQPAATETGVLVFEVPTAEVAGTVLLAEPEFTLDTVKDQKFFAIQ